MKLISKLSLIILLGIASSCAFFNQRTVELAIDSNPAGANIFIEGRNYGVTPTIIKIEPKAYDVVLKKEGHGSASFKTEIWWGTVRTDAFGNKTPDGTRCILDMFSLVFSFNAYNAAKCGDFKQKQYSVIIPRLTTSVEANPNLGLRRDSADINNRYNQDPNASSQTIFEQYQQQNPYH